MSAGDPGPVMVDYLPPPQAVPRAYDEPDNVKPDTTLFEELMKPSPDPYQYMVTSNLKNLDKNHVEYWSTMAPLYIEDPVSTVPIGYVDIKEFLGKIYHELHLREPMNIAESIVWPCHSLWVQFGLGTRLYRMHRHSRILQEVINNYIDIVGDTNLPAHRQVLRFHLEFTSYPPGYPFSQPDPEVTKYLIDELRGPVRARVTDKSTQEGIPEPQVPQLRRSQPKDPQTSVPTESGRKNEQPRELTVEVPVSGGRPSIDRPSTGAITPGTPRPRRPSTSMSALSRTVSNVAQDILHNVTSNSKAAYAKMQGVVANKKAASGKVLEPFGERVGVPGLYNLNGYLPVLNVDDLAEWRRVCSLIPDLDSHKLKEDAQARSIPILRSKMLMTPPQFYSAFQMLSRGSLFLAHDMGIGKTHTVLAALALRVLILTSKNNVKQAWATKSSTKHLPANATHGDCPSQFERPGDVQCFCVPNGVTRSLAGGLRHGVALVQFPATARAEWINAADQAEFSEKSYDFVVVSTSKDVPLKFRKNLDIYRNKSKLKAVGRNNGEPPPQNEDPRFHIKWTPNGSVDLDKSIFLVSFTNTQTWKRAFTYDVVFNDGSKQSHYGALVGASVIDEAHTSYLWNPNPKDYSDTYTMALTHSGIQSPPQWLVTGTPIPATPFESLSILSQPLTILTDTFNRNYEDLGLQVPPMEQLYVKAMGRKRIDDIQAFKAAFTNLFTQNRVLRFMHSSTFFGQPISRIPQIRPTVVSSSTPFLYRRNHKELANKAEYAAGVQGPFAFRFGANIAIRLVREQLYFASVFPVAAALINDKSLHVDDTFMRAEITKLEDRTAVGTIPQVADYWERLGDGNSPKLQAIVKEIRAMIEASVRPLPASRLPRRPGSSVSTHAHGARNSGESGSPRTGQAAAATRKPTRYAKMVIITPTVATAVYLWMYLSQVGFNIPHGPAASPILIHQDLSLADRDRILRRFNSETANYPHTILIGTFDTIGTAANLQRANYEILTSPLPRPREVTQAFGRTNRTGQKLMCVHKILTLEDNPVDRANMAMIADLDVTSNVCNMSERLQTEPLSDARWELNFSED